MPSAAPTADVEGQSPNNENLSRESSQNDSDVDEGGGENENGSDDDNSFSSPPAPLHHSSRLKGYITLLVSALYNYMAAAAKHHGAEVKFLTTLCIDFDDLKHNTDIPTGTTTSSRLKFSMACSMITVIITCAIILCHFDFCTPLRKSVWPKWFGAPSKVELCILLFLNFFWFISAWFNTTIRGPGGEGNDQYNLYFSSWLCCWTSVWTLTRWCTASGRASFVSFVLSWPNRCPLWIVTFILSLADFLFTLDTYRNWDEGTDFNPYVYRLYSEVDQAQWTLLLFVTCVTFTLSLAWVLAEIFRESRTNVENTKSPVE
ncbi:hypothetical protein ACHAXR_006752 [Thalassiosira sp. AJA248-18]